MNTNSRLLHTAEHGHQSHKIHDMTNKNTCPCIPLISSHSQPQRFSCFLSSLLQLAMPFHQPPLTPIATFYCNNRVVARPRPSIFDPTHFHAHDAAFPLWGGKED